MRVTQSGMWSMIRSNLTAIQSRTREVEEQAVGGMMVNRPSDSPELLGQIDRLQAQKLDQEVYGKNSAQALGALDQMDSSLGRVHDALTRVRELAIQVAGGLSNAEQRGYVAQEVASLRTTILDAANVDFGGRYLFSGTGWDTAPFDSTGTYQGSAQAPSARVGDAAWVATGAVGSEVFGGSADIFGTLDAFVAALESDDDAGVSSALDGIDASLKQVMGARADVGSETRIVEDAASLADSLSTQIESRMDGLLSADPADTYMRLSELRSAYSTALQVAASASKQNLFDLI